MDGSLCPKGLWSRKLLYDFNICSRPESAVQTKRTRGYSVGITAADVGNPPSDNTLRKYAGPENGFSENDTTVHFGFVPDEAVNSS